MGGRRLYLLFSFSPPRSPLLFSSPPPPSPVPPLFSLSLPLSSFSLPPPFSVFPLFLSRPVILVLFSLLSLLHPFFFRLPLFSSFLLSPSSLPFLSPSLVLPFLLFRSVLLFLSPSPSLALRIPISSVASALVEVLRLASTLWR